MINAVYNAIGLKADASTSTTSYYTSIATNAWLTTIHNNLALKSDITALAPYYTKVSCDALLNAELTNTTGDVSMANQNISAVDVAVFWNNATKDVEFKRKSVVFNNLSVLNTSTVGNTLTMAVSVGDGGSIRVIPTEDRREASTGYYSYTNSRADVAGDVWVAGPNCWATTGYSIGSPVLNSCLTITDNGDIIMPYIVKTSKIMVDIIRGLTA